ncbi:nucleotide sugar dehydrogenase [Pelagibacterales bacterium SAG-MED32]|nr:nucleotide sugar dehydrogenase [Pelagibacterales bacterium SAG-MED32]
MHRIAVIGLGYVGASLAIMLSQKNIVVGYDTDQDKIDMLNAKRSPINEPKLKEFIKSKELNFVAVKKKEEAYKDAEFVIIATPTNYNEKTSEFDTKSVEEAINYGIKINKKCLFIIKSTVPIGFTEAHNLKFEFNRIIFSPEFIREGNSFNDNLYPSRIIVGNESNLSFQFGEIIKGISKNKSNSVLFMTSKEAEAVKLFSNTYLAMRVAFFNELDSFSIVKKMNTTKLIEGICKDDRIGEYYNNPSFGYGGYCLPKDTKQLLANYKDIPQSLIEATIESNELRKNFIVNEILHKSPKTIGVYRLIMKKDSDNFRSSSIIDLIQKLSLHNKKIIIYEPLIAYEMFNGFEVSKNLSSFKEMADIIITNRFSDELIDVEKKVFSRDIFNKE